MKTLSAVALAAILLCSPAFAAAPADRLSGSYVGTATLDGVPTPFSLEFFRCGAHSCGRWSLPEYERLRMPFRKVVFDSGTGQLSAAPVSGTIHDGKIEGTISSFGGGVFIDAMGFGRKATFSVSRGHPPKLDARLQVIRFRNGNVTLAGTLVRPRRGGPYSTIVFVHGSGPTIRWYYLARAVELAELGFASVIYDKRGCGESTGDWTNASLDDLSRDAVAAVNYAASLPDVDRARIGLWGHSQGGWVVPRALALGAPVAFAIVLAGGATPPREVELYGYRRVLDHVGADDKAKMAALQLVKTYFSYLSGSISYAAIRAELDRHGKAPWFKALGLGRVLPDEGERGNWAWVADYDPAEDISRLRLPLFLGLGGNDEDTPTLQALTRWNADLTRSQALETTVFVAAKANHHFRLKRGPGWLVESPAFRSVLYGWLRGIARR
jgi:fermentation-respiration switch protein FrsA (DUF1100 family)